MSKKKSDDSSNTHESRVCSPAKGSRKTFPCAKSNLRQQNNSLEDREKKVQKEYHSEVTAPSLGYEKIHVSPFTRALVKARRQAEPSYNIRLDSLQKTLRRCETIRSLQAMLFMQNIVVYTGEDGSGKTTAGLICMSSYQDTGDYRARWITQANLLFFDKIIEGTIKTYIVDNFLGHTQLDSVDKWKDVLCILRKASLDLNKNRKFLLITRKSILHEAMRVYGADLAFVVGKANVVEVFWDPRDAYDSLVTVNMTPPNFHTVGDVGFPLCCSLVSSLPTDIRDNLFAKPRNTLSLHFRDLFKGSFIAKTACSYLAFTEGYLSIVTLLESPSVGFLQYTSAMIHLQRELEEQMVWFYHNSPGLILVEEDFVSFKNEAVREAVLMALCETDANLVADKCSLKLLSRLAVVMSDENDTDTPGDKPVLKLEARTAFLRRFIEELDAANYRDTLTSRLLDHNTFSQEFLKELDDNDRLADLLQTTDTAGLPFLFWAGASKDIFSRSLELVDKRITHCAVSALIACCYWGHEHDLDNLFHHFQRNIKRSLRNRTLHQILHTLVLKPIGKMTAVLQKTPFYLDDTLLTMAARRGHGSVVKSLLRHGFPVDIMGKNKTTALMHFSARGDADMVEHLLRENAASCNADDLCMTALHYATYRGEWPVPDGLLHKNNINAQNQLKETPLEAACASAWSLKGIQRLLSKGAQVQVNYKALQWACYRDMVDVVSLLTRLVDLQTPDKVALVLKASLIGPKKTNVLQMIMKLRNVKNALAEKIIYHDVLITAVGLSNTEKLLRLLKHRDVDQSILEMAMVPAMKTGNTQVVMLLLSKESASGIIRNKMACNFFLTACRAGFQDCVKALISRPCVQSNSSLLYLGISIALRKGHVAIVEFLLGGQPSFRVENDGAMLHLAVASDSPAVLEWCQKRDPEDIDVRDSDLWTPFMVACIQGKRSAAMWLADHGANVTAEDINGANCFGQAARRGHQDIMAAIRTACPHQGSRVS